MQNEPLRCAALGALLLLAALPAGAAFDQVLKLGDLAPDVGTGGYTIGSFVEPPSIQAGRDESFVVFHVTLAGSGINANNSHVIYRWSRSTGIRKVARGGDIVVFPDGSNRVLTQLETPIADVGGWVAFTTQMDDFARGLVVWNATTQAKIGVARVGLGVVLQCESISGAPCGPAPGTLTSIATFNDRRGAAFAAYDSAGDFEHKVVFRAPVNAPGFGVPDALWLREFPEPSGPSVLVNLANSLQKADETDASTYFDDFTDVVLCDGQFPVGLATVSRDAPYAVYFYQDFGDLHSLVSRGYAPDATPRRDLHCIDPSLAYIGGFSFINDPGNQTDKGVFFIDIDIDALTQIYRSTVDAPPEPVATTLGNPVGQAVTLDPNFGSLPGTIFAAKLLGPIFAGREGLYIDFPFGLRYTIAYENDIARNVDTIWSAAVNGRGNVALHIRRPDTSQEVRVVDSRGNIIESIHAGDPITIAPGDTRSITTFWLLGGTFGNDVVVTGAGGDGQVGAITDRGELVLLINYSAAPGGQPGVVVVSAPVVPEGFKDGFEDVTP